jgi:hypothetical protein
MSDIDFARSTMLWLQARLHLAERDGEAGQSLLEYVIIVSAISIAAVAVVAFIIVQINAAKSRIVTK